MTTMNIIAVVALAFFATMCIVIFIVWKRESRTRTDSIRAIEYNLDEMGQQLSELSRIGEEQIDRQRHMEELHYQEQTQTRQGRTFPGESQPATPEWGVTGGMQETQSTPDAVTGIPDPPGDPPIPSEYSIDQDIELARQIIEEEKPPEREITYAEINLDFDEEINDREEQPTEEEGIYHVGRSGRKYTATELETLIKE
ncbi:MAG: hypothetical protein Q4C25_06870 [Bacillota bacterium]|nr:hypothetical protein [Bacillota bacterium]